MIVTTFTPTQPNQPPYQPILLLQLYVKRITRFTPFTFITMSSFINCQGDYRLFSVYSYATLTKIYVCMVSQLGTFIFSCLILPFVFLLPFFHLLCYIPSHFSYHSLSHISLTMGLYICVYLCLPVYVCASMSLIFVFLIHLYPSPTLSRHRVLICLWLCEVNYTERYSNLSNW